MQCGWRWRAYPTASEPHIKIPAKKIVHKDNIKN